MLDPDRTDDYAYGQADRADLLDLEPYTPGTLAPETCRRHGTWQPAHIMDSDCHACLDEEVEARAARYRDGDLPIGDSRTTFQP